MNPVSDWARDNPLYVGERSFYKVEKWTRGGSKLDSLLHRVLGPPVRVGAGFVLFCLATFLLSGQAGRLALSCRNETAESPLARNGSVHAVGGQSLDL